MHNIAPKDDPYNHLFSIFVRDDTIENKRNLVTLIPVGATNDIYFWNCLICLNHGKGDKESIELALEIHNLECEGDKLVAVGRADLLDAISNASEDLYSAGWLDGIERVLLLKGGIWLTLAEQYGWPVGYRGEKGWETLDQALTRYNTTLEEINKKVLDSLETTEKK